VVFAAGEPAKSGGNRPVSLIFDTDMGNDIDDALALGLIHSLESRGECKLLAVTLTKDNPYAAPFVDLVNTFYGRGDIPIGVVGGGVTPEDGNYLKQTLTAKDKSGQPYYSYDLLKADQAPEAVSLLRKILAEQPDQSVVIVQVGFSTNLARLLDSGPDDVSPMGGKALAERKVRLLSMMGGAFQDIDGKPFSEYNINQDIPSAKKLFEEWPGQIVASGFEIGNTILYPAESITLDYVYVPYHPLRVAYEYYLNFPYDRQTWDLTSVLYAVRPNRNYFGVSSAGQVDVDPKTCVTGFTEKADGKHRYLRVDDHQRKRIAELFTHLCSQPPQTNSSVKLLN
jgi:inosine-uridine nucleoside N-ribohydrolase